MYKKVIALIALLTLVLTSCGTTDNANTPKNDQKENGVPSEENGQQSPTTEQDPDKINEGKENSEDHIMQYKVNGVEKTAEATVEFNDNQNYWMHVLPDYTFTPEEPHNDIVYVTDQDAVFMRIQLLTDDVDWDEIIDNSKAQLEAINKEIQTISPPAGNFYKDAVIMETSLDEEIITTYLIKNHAIPLKLMTFTTKDADHRDAFLKMAETIKKTND